MADGTGEGRLSSYFRVGVFTALNILVNALTLGRVLWLEGRVRGGLFQNWARRIRNRPQRFVQPATEAEIVTAVVSSQAVRAFGSGHSFNPGALAEETLLSLDRYAGIVRKDLARGEVTFRAGTRVRDAVALLLADGLAFAALPSHDAQSLGGILSTDVHGTGRDWGFVSEHVVALRVVDGGGKPHDVTPSDALFRAAIGGIGAVGLITEVTVRAVKRFNVEQRVWLSTIDDVEQGFERLHASHDHVSLYLFPFSERCQVNTWDRSEAAQSTLGALREWLTISLDALLAAWFGNALAYARLLPRLSSLAHGLKRGTDLVLESNAAFNRTLYHLHEELEFTVPFEQTFSACRQFLSLYEELYERGEALPYTLFEVRFTPAGKTRALIGPGRERRCTWIDLVCNDSAGFTTYYRAAEQRMREIGARPHLGKWCESFGPGDLRRLYGPDFDAFVALARLHDPEGRFMNPFTSRVFGFTAKRA